MAAKIREKSRGHPRRTGAPGIGREELSMARFGWFKKKTAPAAREAAREDAPGEAPGAGGRPGIAPMDKAARVETLTPREKELCLLLVEGYTLRESAQQLNVQYSTANTHANGVYRKLGVSTRSELIINYHYLAGTGFDANAGARGE